MFPHIDSKKVCTLIKHAVTKFSVISSIHYTLAFITAFLDRILSQSRNLYENNIYDIMLLSDPAKRGLMDTITRTKTKTLPLGKIRVCYFSVYCMEAKSM